MSRPDSVDVNPVLSYDIVVNTIPPVRKNNVEILAGQHNVVQMNTPQGFLSVEQSGQSEYKDGVICIIKKPGKTEIITTMMINNSEKLLVGQYDIECTTLPRRIFKNVQIDQSNKTMLSLDQPGVVNFIASSMGLGSIYEIYSDGTQQWVYNLDPAQLRNTVAIQPGKYKVVFRSEKAKGSKYTTIKQFEIKSGSSSNIKL